MSRRGMGDGLVEWPGLEFLALKILGRHAVGMWNLGPGLYRFAKRGGTMRCSFRAIPFLLLGGLAVMIRPPTCRGQEIPAVADRWNRAALEWVRLLQSGHFAQAGDRVDPAVPEGAMGPEQLRELWGQISAQLGLLQEVGPGVVRVQGDYHLADLPAVFQHQNLILRVTLTDSLLVSGFFLRPPDAPPWQPPPYADQTAFHEVDLPVGSEPWMLPGVLAVPEGPGPFPAVVLVHGSGPNDRDETVGGTRPFKDLAWGLASRGIAVLRYDKRTHVHGARMDPEIGLDEEVVLDALAALARVREQVEVQESRVFLLGHSLGGIMAPSIASRDGRLAGLVVLAAPARPFFQVLKDQLGYLAGLEPDPGAPGRVQLDSLADLVTRVEAGDAAEDQVILGAPPAYWREVAGVDPVGGASELSVPMLILQGGRDYQSTAEDLSLWKDALGDRTNVTLKLYPKLNHLFVPGTGMATPEEYSTSRGHVAEEVIEDLSAWIKGVEAPPDPPSEPGSGRLPERG